MSTLAPRRVFLETAGTGAIALLLRPVQPEVFWLQKLLDDGVSPITLPRGSTICPKPLVVPAGFVPTIDGNNTAMLVWREEDQDGIVATGPLQLSGVTLVTTAQRGGDAIRVTSPKISSGLKLRDVTIKGNGSSSWRKGVVLHNCWNATLEELAIAGYPDDLTPAQLANARMEVAIDCGNAQEMRIVRVMVNNAKTGIRVMGPAQGDGEGFHLDGRFVINCETCLRLEGWKEIPTGPAWVNQTHFFSPVRCILATDRNNLTLNGVDCCGSHLAGPKDEAPTGLHAVNCPNLRVTGGSTFRRTYAPEWYGEIVKDPRVRKGYGAVIDASSNALVTGNDFQESLSIGLYFSSSTRNCRAFGNFNREPLNPVVNLGRDNQIGV